MSSVLGPNARVQLDIDLWLRLGHENHIGEELHPVLRVVIEDQCEGVQFRTLVENDLPDFSKVIKAVLDFDSEVCHVAECFWTNL